MCIAAMGGLASGAAGRLARSGMFGLAGKLIAGRQKPKPDRAATLYPDG